MYYLRIIICVGVSLLGASLSSGQQSTAGQDSGSTSKHRRVFRLSSLGEWKGAELYLKAGSGDDWDSMQKVSLLDMGYSAPMPYRVGTPVMFYKKSAGGAQPFEKVLSVMLKPGVKDPLILLIPQKDKPLFRVFDLDPVKFPYGSCQMVNFSRMKLQVAMNKDSRSLAPGRSVLYAPAGSKEVRSWLRVAEVTTKKMVFSSMTIRRSKKRMLVFMITGSDQTRPLKTRMLVDFKQTPVDEG